MQCAGICWPTSGRSSRGQWLGNVERTSSQHVKGPDWRLRQGAGSSDSRTRRYGQEFSQAQVFTHVGEAVLKALRVIAAGQAEAGIAVPDSRNHRLQVELIRVALRRLGIIVFWVREDGTVSADGSTST
jgi:hypothetical protein